MALLDDLDKRLIAELRADGRAPVSKLAASLGVSRATIQTRLDRLLETGVVLGFTVRASEGADENAIRAVMLVKIAGHTTTAVISHLRRFPELHAFHTTNGEWDLVVEIRADNVADFDAVLRNVRRIEYVINSETSILLRSFS